MSKYDIKKLAFSAFTAVCALFVMSLSAYAWFFFPLTQNTSVYTDGVTDIEVKAYVYNRQTEAFGSGIEAAGTPAIISLNYYDNNGNVNIPYFFLWGGEYTSNDIYQTIYKIEVTYGNEAEAYPAKLGFYGDFEFDFRCMGNDNEEYNVRFMKLSYFVPDDETAGDYLNTSLYIPFGDTDYTDGSNVTLSTIQGNPAEFQTYVMTFYLLFETDILSLNEKAYLIAEEFGLLDADYAINISLYCRTLPVNEYNP